MGREVQHIATILDGNGRWAEKHGTDIRKGHLAGFGKFREMAIHALDHHPTVTEFDGWAFDPANMKRGLREVVGIFLLMAREVGPLTDELIERGVRFEVIGDMQRVPKMARRALENAISRTSTNTRLKVGLNIMYNGREDVLLAMKKLAKEGADIANMTNAELDVAITERLFSARSKPVDLLFIPGAAKGIRIRDYYMWQIRDAHVHGIDTLLPDVTMEELDFAILRAGSSNLTHGARPTTK